MSKRCVTCGEEKASTEFHRSKSNPDGLHKQCKACRKACAKKSYARNREDIARRAKERYAANPEPRLAAARVYRVENRERIAAVQAAHYRANKQQIQQYRRAHYERNIEKYFSAAAARRSLMRRLPSWADARAIEAFYAEARALTKRTGVVHHVDHIVPLQNDRVCGLHVQSNLQVVPAAVNLAKKNRFEEASQ